MADPVVHITNGIPDAGTGNVTTLGQTLLDGANVTYGAIGDLAVTAGAAGSISAKLRSISRDLVGGIVLQPGANVIGAVTQSGGPWSVSGTLAATQSGTWNITNITGTVSLPTGAATSALQPTNAAIASTTAGQTGHLGMGATTTAAPSYTTGQTNPLSLTTAGALRVDGSGVTQTVSGTVAISGAVAATQSGTWTVQPGNTANTTPWLITIQQGGNAATVSAGGALKVDGSAVTQPVSAASLPLPTGAATAALQPTNAAQGSTTSGQTGTLVQGAVATAAPSYTNGTTSPLSITVAGAVRVDGSAVTQPVSGTVAATQSGTWSTRTLDGSGNAITSDARGSARPLAVEILDASGNQITSFGAGSGPSFGSAVPSTGTAVGFNDGTNLQMARVFDADSGAGTQYVLGALLKKPASGGSVDFGTSSDPIRIDPTGTTTQPVSLTSTTITGTVAVTQSGTWNVTNISGTISLPTGASTSANQPSNAAQGSSTSGQTGNLAMGAVTTGNPSYTTGQTSPLSLDTSGAVRVNVIAGSGGGGTSSSFGSAFPATGTAIGAKDSAGTNMTFLQVNASNALKVDGSAVTQPVSGTVAATQSGNWTDRIVGNAGGIMDFVGQNAAAPANSLLIGGEFNTTPTTITSGNASPLQLDSAGNLLVNIKAGAGSGGTASSFGAAFPATGTAAGAEYLSTPPTLTNGQMVALQTNVSGALKIDGSAVTQPVSGTFWQATQPISGTVTANQGGAPWTVAPDGTSWAKTGTSANVNVTNASIAVTGTFWQATQPISAASLPLPSGASTAANQTSIQGVIGAATAPASMSVIGGVFNTTKPTLTTGQSAALQANASGSLLVDGSAVTQPVSGSVSISGTATVSGTVTANQGGAPWTMKPDGTAWALTGTSANVNVTNASIAVTGTFFQATQPVSIAADVNVKSSTAPVSTMNSASANSGTTAALAAVFDDVTPTAITENSFGYARMSANRNLYGTIRDAAGNERGANVTAGNALTVDASATTQPVSIAAAVTVQQSTAANLKGQVDPLTAANWGIGTSTQNSATVANGHLVLGQFNTTPTAITSGNMSPLQLNGSGSLRVDGSGVTQPVSGTFWQATQPISGTVTANQGGAPWSENVTQFGGTNISTGTGTGGAGIPRVTVSNDSVVGVSGSVTVAQATASNLKAQVDPLTTANWGLAASTQNVASPTNAQLVQGQFNTTPTTLTTGNVSPLQLDNAGNLLVNIKAGAGSGGTASNFGAAFPSSGTAAGAEYLSSPPTLTSGQMVALQTNVSGALKIDGSAVTQPVSGTFWQATQPVSGTVTSNILGGAGATLDFAGQNNAATLNSVAVGGQFNTTPTTITSGRWSPLQLTANADLRVNLRNNIGSAIGHYLSPVYTDGTAAQSSSFTGWTSATGLNTTVQFPFASTINNTVVGSINQTTTITGGAVTFEESFDGGTNYKAIPAGRLIDPATGAQLANPYTFVANTQQAYQIISVGAQLVRARLSTVVAGTGSVQLFYTESITSVETQVFQNNAANLLTTARVIGATGGTFDFASTQNIATPGQAILIGGEFNTTPTTITSGNCSPLQLDTNGNVLVNIKATVNQQCVGEVASGATDSGNPQKFGGLAKTTNPTAVSDGQRVNALFDKLGKQVAVGAIRDLKKVQATSITAATETTVVTAGAAGVFNDVYGIVVTNKSATAVSVAFKDSTGGTTRTTIAAPAGETRGFTLSVDSAMVQATAANNWTATVSSAVTSIEITMLYVQCT